jgi:hypothetical protein
MRGQRIKDRLDWNWMDAPPTAGAMLIIMMILGVFMLIGCAAPIEGVVAGKDVDPGRTEEVWRTERWSCGTEYYTVTETSNGKSKQVRKSRTKYCDRRIRDYRRIPPRWQFNIRKDDGQMQWVTVSETIFRQVQIGERWNTGQPERISPAR